MVEDANPILTIRSRRHVWLGVVGVTIVTLLAVWIPIIISVLYYVGSFKVAVIICAQVAIYPLSIMPPLSWFMLSIARLQTSTIERLDAIVRNDPLTGVFSRLFFLGRVSELARSGGVFLMIDADHFKAINDTHGHSVGDVALKRLADILRAHMPETALLGRLGGEEFGTFLPQASEEEARVVAAKLCEATRAHGRVVVDIHLNMTVSIGGATLKPGESLDEIIKFADRALYLAKNQGRDRFCFACMATAKHQ